MKIISNFKDYYDFLVGVYGMDDKCVYKRICSTEVSEGTYVKTGIYIPEHKNFPDKTSSGILSICDKLYTYVYYKGKVHYGEDILNLPNRGNVRHLYTGQKKGSHIFSKEFNFNTKTSCPIILCKVSFWDEPRIEILNPKLSDFEFGKCMTPEEIYMEITDFIMKEPEVTDNRNDIQKLESKGFDKKVSFRHRK